MKTKFWNMQVRAADPKVGEVYLYSEIASTTWWGDEITPLSFKADLDALGEIDELHLYVNSPGGDVFAGIAIYNMVKRHKAAKKVAHVDGLAASIASVVITAADTVIMPENAMQMVHNPWTFMFGGYNADQLQKMAEDLTAIREPLITSYVSKTGLSRDEVVAIMDAETWMDAATCKEKGFADEIEEAKKVAASLKGDTLAINGAEFSLACYRNRPKMNDAVMGSAPPGPPVVPSIQDKGRVLSADNEAHIRTAHDALGKVLDKLDAQADEAAGDDPDAGVDNPDALVQPPAPGTKADTVAKLQILKAQIQTKRRR